MPMTKHAAATKDRAQPTAPSFQHRHYAEIARIIRDYAPPPVGDDYTRDMIRRHVADAFADGLRHSNPKFDRARFLAACREG